MWQQMFCNWNFKITIYWSAIFIFIVFIQNAKFVLVNYRFIMKKNQNFNDVMVHWISWLQSDRTRSGCARLRLMSDLPSSKCQSAADVTIHVNFLEEETPVVKPVYPPAPPPPVAPVWLRDNLLYWCDLRIL